MTITRLATAALALGAIPFVSNSAMSQQFGSPEFVIVGTHIDNVQGPSTIFQTAQDCQNSDMCMALARIVSAATEIPIDKFITAAASLSTNREGEGTFMKIGLPTGYSYCSSSMKLTSIVPRDGDRGSTFLGRADPNGLYVETWTPVQGPFDGRSWVQGDVSVVGVRTDVAGVNYATGNCRPPDRAIFYCRGSGCEAGAVDNGQNVNTSSAPGAGSRN